MTDPILRKPRPEAVAVEPIKRFRRDFSRCPRCGAATRAATSYIGVPSEFYLECSECNTYINTYIPMEHQEAVHRDPHTYIGNFGAYGTGKTTTSREEVFKHCFITPSANVLIGADVTSQYEQTIKREIEKDIPVQLVADVSNQKNYMDLVNGARIMYRPFDDVDKLRSYNLTMFVIVEGSQVKAEAFHQLKTRTRNMAAAVFEKVDGKQVYDYDARGMAIPRVKVDWRRGIIESNPDSGWIRTDVLLSSEEIHKHGQVADVFDQTGMEKDPAIASHVASTDVNRFLPPTFIRELCANKPKWWIARYVNGSFAYSEGLVYPNALIHIVPTATIPPEWKRIIAFDYGLNDDAVFLFGAVDPKQGILYIYKEARTNNRNVKELAELYFSNSKDIPSGGLICAPIADPKSLPKRDYNKDSLADLFLEEGIAFQAGYISVDARIFRLNTYFESGRLKIMDCCTGLIGELREYKFKAQSLERNVNTGKPEDKNNHAINPLEWITMELPSDPRNILHGVYNRFGEDVTQVKPQDKVLPFALRDDPFTTRRDAETAYDIQQFQFNF